MAAALSMIRLTVLCALARAVVAGYAAFRPRAAPPRAVLPTEDESAAALSLLLSEAGLPPPDHVSELTAGFCNWVYRVDYPAPTGSVVAKLFSPLARLRLSPAMRGMGDARAAAEGLGPRLHYLSTEGLVVDFVQGAELTEGDIHADAALRPRLLGTIASHLAQLHSLRLPHTRMPAAGAAGRRPMRWSSTGCRPPLLAFTRFVHALRGCTTRDISSFAPLSASEWNRSAESAARL